MRAQLRCHLAGQTDSGVLCPGADAQDEGSNVVLGEQDRQVVQLAGQVLAAACAMDLHSALQTAQASMHSQHVIGLVEEVSKSSLQLAVLCWQPMLRSLLCHE